MKQEYNKFSEKNIKIKLLLYPIAFFSIYYLLVELPMSYARGDYRYVYDDKTGLAYKVK